MVKTNRKETIVIDVDGVIAEDVGSYANRKILEGAKESIDKIRKEYLVVLNTGRHICWSETTIKWLKDNKIKYDLIQFGKPPAKLYIDDKGMEHKSWKTTIQAMKDNRILKV